MSDDDTRYDDAGDVSSVEEAKGDSSANQANNSVSASGNESSLKENAGDGCPVEAEKAAASANQACSVSASGNEPSVKENDTDTKDDSSSTRDLAARIFSSTDANRDGVLSFVLEADTMELQAYVDSEMEHFLEWNPTSEILSLHERVGKFIDLNYYTWTRTFLSQKSFRNKKFAHGMRGKVFINVIPPQTLQDDSLIDDAFATCARMKESIIPMFDAALWKEWTTMEEALALIDGNDSTVIEIEKSFVEFLESTYYATMKQCIDKYETSLWKFKLPVPLDHDASPETQALRKDLLERASEEDFEKINCIIKDSWNKVRASLPPNYQSKFLVNVPSQKYLEKHWYNTLAETVGQSQHTPIGTVTDPTSTPSTLMITQHEQSQSQSQASIDTLSGMDFFLSTSSARVEIASEAPKIEYLSAAALLASAPKTKCHFQGKLVGDLTEPRTITWTSSPASSPQRRPRNSDGQYVSEGSNTLKRKRGEEEETHVLDVLLVDKTGPIIMTLWGDEAKTFSSKVEQCQQRCQDVVVDCKFVEVNTMQKNNWNGNCVTQMRQLKSLEAVGDRAASTIACIGKGTVPALTSMSFKLPSSEVCMYQFTHLTAPCRGTFKGVVMELGATDYSQSGTEHRTFKLVDESGRFYHCQASFHNLKCGALQENREVILFFAVGRPPLKSKDGHLYMFRDSLIVPLGEPRMLYSKPKLEMSIAAVD